jgi:hypothetical protein
MAGIAAAVAFLGITGLLGTAYLWLSAGLAVAVYFGARLMVPSRPVPQEPKRVSPAERLETLKATAAQVRDTRVAERITAVCDRAARLLQYLKTHPLKRAESEFMIGQYLDLSERAVQLFLTTGAADASARQSREKLFELLDGVSERFQKLYEKLAEQDDTELAGEIQTLNQTLDELDQVCNAMQGEYR